MRWFAPWLLVFGCTEPESQRPVTTTPADVEQVIYDLKLEPGATNADILAAFFSGEEVESIRIDLTDEAYAQLEVEPTAWVPATFIWRDLVYTNVGVRLKGNGSFRPVFDKPSLKVEFDKFEDGQDFFGLDVLVLNNMISDHTKIKERLAYSLYREAGVPAVRAAHSTLRFHDDDYGLYTHMEDVDERMLALWFDDPSGPLYELFDGILQQSDWPEAFEYEGGIGSTLPLTNTFAALELPREEAIVAVEDHTDLDAFLRFYAVSGYIGQFDAWPLRAPGDDVHLYLDPASSQVHFIPHGLDESFAQFFRNVAIPGDSLLAQACYFTDDCHERLEAHFWEVSDTANAMDLQTLGGEMILQINQHAMADLKDETTVENLWAQQAILADYIEQRDAHLEENLGPR